ncbi:MAG: leucine-rich repeat protein, partial [Oscillospiraceae bacterium]|nr:leucine-rich repeat protein [Oscillospiraceae bacterium]
IGDGAFEDCKLTSISIPSKVNSICALAFCGCPLTEVTVPANVEEIKHDAFNCTALSDITILNPACILFDDVSTIYSSATIHGFVGSTAEEYANKYDRRFEALTSPASVSGDFNGDGEITVADAVLLIRFITEDSSLTQDEIDRILSGQPDFNGDGLVTITDVTELLNQLQPAHKPEVTITEINVPDGLADDDRFELVGQWYDISSPDYDGLPLSGDVFLTAPIPGAFDPEDLGGYVFVYYDEETGACRYLFPDSYDLTAGTMTIDLPHFSFWGAAKLTNEEQIEAFLNSYSTKLAVARGNSKKSASELEPYVRLKAEAMGLTKQATEDLIQSSLNFLGGRFTGKNKAFIESATKYTTTLTRGFYDNDGTAALSGLEDAITDALLNSWDELKFSDRLDKVLGSEFAGSTTAKLLSSTNGIARMAGYMAGGDPPAAMKELGSILQGIHPAVELGTKAVAYLGARINEEFTNWKSNQIEELYRIYKNGAEDIWGNEVIPCNRDSFLTYLNTSSGFTMAKGVARFYNLDKVSEICEKYGWPYSTYEELPPRYIKEFQQRAEDGLMQYFELRVQQEKTAEEIKKTERACIETMMTSGYGALYSGAYRKFFGEETPDDYNLTARLERLVNVRSFVSQYVDEDKLAEAAKVDNSYNYGDILNWWVDLASNNEKSVAIQKFREELRTHGFLKEFTDQKVTSLVLEKTVDDSGCSHPNSNYSEYTIFYRVKDVKTDTEGNEVIVWKDDSLKRNYPFFSPGSYKSEVWTLLKNAEISVSADGKISCSQDGVKVEGGFDPITKTGLGTLSIHTKCTYDYREDTERYCRSCITLENHYPNDAPDYYVDRTIDLTLDLEIMPSSDGTGVLFILNGGGTVASSGEVIDTISGIIEDRSVTPKKLLEAESGLVITGRPFSDRFAVTFEDVQYLYLLK